MGYLCVVTTEEIQGAKLLHSISTGDEEMVLPITSMNPTNGARIILAPGQLMLQLKNKKIVDVIHQPGMYYYHEKLEKNEKTAEYAEALDFLFLDAEEITEQTELVRICSPKSTENMEVLKGVLLKEFTGETDAEQEEPQAVQPQEVSQPVPEEKAQNSSAISFCPNCGTDMRMHPGAKFCMKCGNRLPE